MLHHLRLEYLRTHLLNSFLGEELERLRNRYRRDTSVLVVPDIFHHDDLGGRDISEMLLGVELDCVWSFLRRDRLFEGRVMVGSRKSCDSLCRNSGHV